MAGKQAPLNIVFVASECVPFAKTGGLADVVGSLPGEIAELGHKISVVVPYYRSVRKAVPAAVDTGIELAVTLGDESETGSVLKYTGESGTDFYFIRNDDFYDRDNLYGTPKGDYKDNATRFTFFSKAVLHLIGALAQPVDILHCHDWQTGLVPAFIRYGMGLSPALKKTKTIFTIHNLAYQGLFWYYDLKMTGLPNECFRPEGLEFFGQINFLKAGIVSSDAITTVSRKYSREIQTKEFGCGLEGVLVNRKKDIHGILNGVDYGVWSPENDNFIAEKFSSKDVSGKRECRRDLLKKYGLKVPDEVPVIGCISRLADQKGFDLIAARMEEILDLGAAFVLLGTGDNKYHKIFKKIGKEHPTRAGIKIAFSEKLAHKIEAGSDMFLMPSRYEPCGLNQMYSLRYGTVPIVRATGGLDDTISNYNPETRKGNGFKFKSYKPEELLSIIKTAVRLFARKQHWKQVMKNGMAQDFSWRASAKKYVGLYSKLMK